MKIEEPMRGYIRECIRERKERKRKKYFFFKKKKKRKRERDRSTHALTDHHEYMDYIP